MRSKEVLIITKSSRADAEAIVVGCTDENLYLKLYVFSFHLLFPSLRIYSYIFYSLLLPLSLLPHLLLTFYQDQTGRLSRCRTSTPRLLTLPRKATSSRSPSTASRIRKFRFIRMSCVSARTCHGMRSWQNTRRQGMKKVNLRGGEGEEGGESGDWRRWLVRC